ncbi:thioredoxin family protein [Pseudomonas viridiflava]|uniref:thioredoxin family protein n=1 Tax=Pseudomonas viridiflava TaxID=33069 RepID=UPI0018E661C6|nr:thioredoxin-like superfamily, group II member protein [Pseudomonas viridiflava]MBI6705024.1 thioredoxin-like superfamily, group II member protein [Pseudomonas viridiflava]MBI6723194.1 thioredoxin-like superfamily, group II member protein [Pseudomonas viridiflava]
MSVEMVSDSTFQKSVIDVSQEKLVVVEFSTKEKLNKRGEPNASAKMDSVIDGLDAQYAGEIEFFRVEVNLVWDYSDPQKPMAKDDLNPAASSAYEINHGPTLVFLLEGERVQENLLGFYDEASTRQKLDELLKDLNSRLLKIKLFRFIEEQINLAAQWVITKKSAQLDDIAYGKLGVFLGLRRTLQNDATAQDIGMLDGMNDSLQCLGVLDKGETILERIK